MISINEDLKTKPCKHFMKMVSVQNVTLYFKLASIFKLPRIARALLSYIERLFTMVAKSKMFLEMDYDLVRKILLSSCLEITSELEVFDAADEWIRHNQEKRSIRAKDLLLTVRLPLLSEYALQLALSKNSSFRNNDLCLIAINDILNDKKSFFQSKPQSYHTNRYCDQREFDVLFTYGCVEIEIFDWKLDTSLKRIDGSNFNNINLLTTLPEKRNCNIAVYVNGEVYYFWCSDETGRGRGSVYKYSFLTNSSEKVVGLTDVRTMHCCCAFMGKVYIIGGFEKYDQPGALADATGSCVTLDPKENKCEEVAGMNSVRTQAACAVFDGRITVTGGFDFDRKVKTVEMYDHVADKWFMMPDMVVPVSDHGSVAVRNKLYVLANNYLPPVLQVYDKTSKHFAVLKVPLFKNNNFFSLGSRLVSFSCDKKAACWYDPEKNKWSEEDLKLTDGFEEFCFVKVPRF